MNLKYYKNRIKQNKILYYIISVPYMPIKVYHMIINLKYNKDILKENYEILKKIDMNEKNIFYLGVPLHNNLGDMAQTFSTEKWLKENYNSARIYEFNTYALLNTKFIKSFAQKIKSRDLIFIQSGYCSHELHLDHKMHKKIIRRFIENRIIILPQTININNPKEISATSKIFNNHDRLLFLARDKISYEKAKNILKIRNIKLYPDIVTSLIGTRYICNNRKNILFCIRDDSEKYYSDKQLNKLKNKLEVLGQRVDWTDTTIKNMSYKDFHDNFNEILESTLSQYETYKVIITDRYHGTIFSMIANTPVIVLATNDHKVKSGVEWFIEYNYKDIYYAKSLEEAYDFAKMILNENRLVCNNDYFNDVFYKHLKEEINKL